MERVNVTKSFLPPIEEYMHYVARIWESGQLTNQGPLLQEFEAAVKRYLGVDNFHFVTNGTLALQLALRSLDITEGEVITTPFSYVATTSAILWEHCTPVFVDIEPDTFCIDANKIEAAITSRTRAIVAVHVFGYPCDVEKIEAIAAKHNLKVIYDAAHAFGATYKGRSLLDYGDISISSFHATKLFHTIEGGCLVVKDGLVHHKVEHSKRFGHNGDDHIMLGINAKASEFQVAMGLCNLKYIDSIIEQRKVVVDLYNKLLGNKFHTLKSKVGHQHNYAYYPLLMKSAAQLEKALAALAKIQIFPRRYFHPSLNTLPYLSTTQACPVSEDIASRIVCLPLYPGLDKMIITKIHEIIKQ
jgi:dTDP-4-amino-4,6-dideoxygalactose transaminase